MAARLLLLPFLLLLFVSSSAAAASWQDNILPRIRIASHETDAEKFEGNSTQTDHFRLLVQDGETVLVGSRDIVYNISLTTLKENKRLEWRSTEEDVRLCRMKGKSEDECHNYIRVLAKKSDDLLLVCGTNSFKPRCRDYLHSPSGEYEVLKDSPGEGLSPYDPRHSSTAVFAGTCILRLSCCLSLIRSDGTRLPPLLLGRGRRQSMREHVERRKERGKGEGEPGKAGGAVASSERVASL